MRLLEKLKKADKRKMKDILGSILIAIMVIVYLTDVWKLSFGKLTNPGPAFLPVISGIFVLILCAVGILKAIFSKSQSTQQDADLWEEDSGVPIVTEDKASAFGPLCVMAALLVYIAAVGTIGFFCTTAVLVFFLLRLLKFKNWWISLITTIVIMALSYVVFTLALEIRFPTGLLF